MRAKSLQCAIYTRVSSEQGLVQNFNSLDAQREAAASFIKSQTHEGWRMCPDRYDDGGFSGGSLDRPALQKLMADVAERRVDIVIVYKVDRLTRVLADFATLINLFDSKGVSFVSVTQNFNTTSSMGRLTLNVLLSFAQFEREITSERIRDKIAASKKKGVWMGGGVPLGFLVENRKLIVNEAEAEIVRLIFRRCLEIGSMSVLQRELRILGIRSRSKILSTGNVLEGKVLSKRSLLRILQNRTYLGEVIHKGLGYKGEHAAIINMHLFAAVQAQLAKEIIRNSADYQATRCRNGSLS